MRRPWFKKRLLSIWKASVTHAPETAKEEVQYMSIGLEVFLILLSISTSLCTIVLFFVTRSKDHHKTGEQWGSIKADLRHIKDAVGPIQSFTERLAKLEMSVESAHRRIDEIIQNKL